MNIKARRSLRIVLCGLLLGAASCEKSPDGASSSPSPTAASGGAAGTGSAAATYSAMHAALGRPLLDAVTDGTPADAMLAQHSAHVDQLVEASKAPTCDFGIDYSAGPGTQLPHLADQRRLARVLRADASRLLAAGDKDGAAKRTAAIFRMASQMGGSARTGIELLVAMAIAELGCDFVQETPALTQAAWKTDIQHALADVERNVVGGAGEAVKRDGELTVMWLRSASDADVVALKEIVKPRTRAEREAAATKLEAINAEAVRAWNESQAKSRLAALADRAHAEGLDDLFPKLDILRDATDHSRASVEKTKAALAK